jgi:hypothetical protein
VPRDPGPIGADDHPAERPPGRRFRGGGGPSPVEKKEEIQNEHGQKRSVCRLLRDRRRRLRRVGPAHPLRPVRRRVHRGLRPERSRAGSTSASGPTCGSTARPAGEGSFIVEGNLEANGVDTLGNSVTTPGPFNLAFYTFNADPDTGNGEPEDALQPGVHWLSFIAQTTTEADFGGLSLVKFFGPEILYIGKVGGNGGTEWGIDPGGNQQSAGGDVNEPTFIVVKLTIGPAPTTTPPRCLHQPDPGGTPPATADPDRLPVQRGPERQPRDRRDPHRRAERRVRDRRDPHRRHLRRRRARHAHPGLPGRPRRAVRHPRPRRHQRVRDRLHDHGPDRGPER